MLFTNLANCWGKLLKQQMCVLDGHYDVSARVGLPYGLGFVFRVFLI